MDGIINVYKEKGFTSFDVVAKLRGIVRQKKIGHTGTLDPDAEGVLPVCLGTATRACELLLDKDKEYEAVLLLGRRTDTQDISGKVLEEREVTLSQDMAEKILMSFVGSYEQIPPMYSAVKVGGKKLYELAREGKEVERAPRKVTIYSIKILAASLEGEEKQIRFLVRCSKGTYIRTLCEDAGEKMGCGGCLKSLVRTRVSSFLRKESLTLKEIEERQREGRMEEILMPTDRLFLSCQPLFTLPFADLQLHNGNKLKPEYFAENFAEMKECNENGLKPEYFAKMEECNGNKLKPENFAENFAKIENSFGKWRRVYDSAGRFCALYEYDSKEGIYRNVKMFL